MMFIFFVLVAFVAALWLDTWETAPMRPQSFLGWFLRLFLWVMATQITVDPQMPTWWHTLWFVSLAISGWLIALWGLRLLMRWAEEPTT